MIDEKAINATIAVGIFDWIGSCPTLGIPPTTMTFRKIEHMARPKKTEGNLDAIAAERARLKAELSKLDALEKQARQAASDAGRSTLLAALERVKIGSMSKAAAKVIAVVIAAEGGDGVAKKLGE